MNFNSEFAYNVFPHSKNSGTVCTVMWCFIWEGGTTWTNTVFTHPPLSHFNYHHTIVLPLSTPLCRDSPIRPKVSNPLFTTKLSESEEIKKSPNISCVVTTIVELCAFFISPKIFLLLLVLFLPSFSPLLSFIPSSLPSCCYCPLPPDVAPSSSPASPCYPTLSSGQQESQDDGEGQEDNGQSHDERK